MTERNRREGVSGTTCPTTGAAAPREGRAAPRLFVEDSLTDSGAHVHPGDQACHYLLHVLRRKAGDEVRLFNGRDGEWRTYLLADRRRPVLALAEHCRAQVDDPALDLWLAFAPVKRSANEWLIEKATELGVSRILPVLVGRGETRRVNIRRWRTIAREAAEQCERLSLPEIVEPVKLDRLLDTWPRRRRLFAARERVKLPHLDECLSHDGPTTGQVGLLIGPEGGFTNGEHALMATAETRGELRSVSLGPRILRAETAALAGLALIAARLDRDTRACEEGAGRSQ